MRFEPSTKSLIDTFSVSVKELFNFGQSSDFEKIKMYFWMGLESTEWCLNNSIVQSFINREDLHFDLIFAEQFFQESLLMFAHKFNAPIGMHQLPKNFFMCNSTNPLRLQ